MKSGLRKQTHLRLQFTIMTILMIAIIMLVSGCYIFFFTKDLTEQISYQNSNFNKALATMVFELVHEDLVNDSYENIESKVRSMITNNIIAYIIVADNENGDVLYASDNYLEGKSLRFAKEYIKRNLKNNYENQSTYYITGHSDNENIYVGYYQNSYIQIFLQKLINNLSLVAVFSILFSIILASFMSKLVIRPILDLSRSVLVFGRGNFKHRIESSDYIELNTLVNSFNQMATSLQDVYASLEQKVEERTAELKTANNQLKEAQAMMVHSEKMRSLGELVAGITHEINNPINFIYGNLIHLTKYTKELIQLIDMYIDAQNEIDANKNKEIENYKNQIDYSFLKEDLPALIKSCQEGTERTRNIIADLKNFSRIEEQVVNSVDLEKEIDTTLNILHSKLKNRIEVHKQYEPNLPRIDAFGGQLNQVFMNILDNAAFAIENEGNIYIRIHQDLQKKNVIIEFEDDGSGMDEDTSKKIFDPFFTTKAPGQGTGLGMSISYKVIQRHKGTISVASQKGKGTKFTITLPIVRENG